MVWWHTKDIKISLLLQKGFVVWMEMSILVLRMLLWKQDKIHIFLENSRRDNFDNSGQFAWIMRLVLMVWIIPLLFIQCTRNVLCWIEKCFRIWQLQILKFLLKSLILLNNIELKFLKSLYTWEIFIYNCINHD